MQAGREPVFPTAQSLYQMIHPTLFCVMTCEKEFDTNKTLQELKGLGVRIMNRTTAFGLYDNCVIGLLERVTDHVSNPDTKLPRQRFWTIRAKHIIVGSGALERHIAFNNNDIPGVMNVNAAKHYLNRYGVLAGENITLATNNDSVYQTAIELHEAGSKVTVLDSRKNINVDLPKEIELHLETLPFSINGSKKIESLDVCKASDKKNKNTIICDQVLVSGGWSPIVHLVSHRGIKPVWNEENLCFVPGEIKENITVVGSAKGIWNNKDCINSGIVGAVSYTHLTLPTKA